MLSKKTILNLLPCGLCVLAPAPCLAQSAYTGTPYEVSLQNTGLPTYTQNGQVTADFPDGHLPVLWDGANSTSQVFWSENQSFATYGSTVESSSNGAATLGAPPVYGAYGDGATSSGDRSHPTYFDNSGSWLMSAFRVNQGTFTLNPSSTYLIGFYHGEDHWYTDAAGSRAGQSYYHDPVAWLGIGLITSADNGRTWTKHGMIAGVPDLKPKYPNSSTPPSSGPFGGIGNHATVLDTHSNPSKPAWVTFFPMINANGIGTGHGISALRSTNPNGTDGSWYAFYNGSFSTLQRTHQGQNSPLPGLDGASDSDYNHYALANPSVHWNTTLNRWVLVAGTWDLTKIMVSYSSGTSVTGGWTKPVMIYTAPAGSTLRYPTIVGTDHLGHLSDTEAGTNTTMYWAQFDAQGVRKAMATTVTLVN